LEIISRLAEATGREVKDQMNPVSQTNQGKLPQKK